MRINIKGYWLSEELLREKSEVSDKWLIYLMGYVMTTKNVYFVVLIFKVVSSQPE